MITTTSLSRQRAVSRPSAAWQRELAQAICEPLELCRALALDPQLALDARAVQSHFPLRVPRGFVKRMRSGDAADPLLRQVLPLALENLEAPGFEADPLGEREAMRAPGLLHKYHGRALLITTGACAVHCRYCFRREFPCPSAQGQRGRWREALDALAQDSSIQELILSGGDPLSLSTDRLTRLTDELRHIPHLRRLRLHTRTAIVLPERVDDELLSWLQALTWPCVIVLHCNHANEIDASVREATALLKSTGASLLNQSVLLAGINDSVDALCALSEALWSAGVMPYYLHLLDRVRGTAHFEVGELRARQLMSGVTAKLPGYLVPRLARESPGAASKTVLAAGWDALHSPPEPECLSFHVSGDST
jgi:EF-P beta-lysylation protein EpmB